MNSSKNTWKSIRSLLRKFDFLGESFTFRYKDEDKHSTELGGIMCILFYAFAIAYFIYDFIPFSKKKNFTLQYYSMKLSETKKMNFSEYPIAFAFGLTVDDKINPTINDLLEIKVNFTDQKHKDKRKIISLHSCKYSDFPIEQSELKNH